MCFECENNVEPIERLEPELVWSYDIPVGVQAFSDDVMPVIENGYTYVASDTMLRCVELESGDVKWKTLLGIPNNRIIRSKKLLHSDNLLFLNHAEWVKAFNKSDGSLVWETTLANFEDIDLSIMSQDQNSLILGGRGEFIKFNKFTGAIELRRAVTEMMYGGNLQSAQNPIISDIDDYIYVPTGYNTAIGLKGNLLCYNSETGEFLWGFPTEDDDTDVSSCAIKNDFAVFVSGSSIYALNRFTGKKLWQTKVQNDGFAYSVIIDKETVYIGSHALSFMYAFELQTGKLKWKSEDTPSSIITIPTVIEDRIYFTNWAYIYVLNTSNGSTLWKSLPPEYKDDNSYRYKSSVAVGEGYMVCVGNKKVYCLTDPWYK